MRITSFPKSSPSSLVGSESADESVDGSESSQYDQLLDFIHFSNEVSAEESRITNVLTFLFDHFGLGLLQAYIGESDGIDDLPLNAMVGMTCSALFSNYVCVLSVHPVSIRLAHFDHTFWLQVIDALLSKVVKDFSALLVSQGTQVGSRNSQTVPCWASLVSLV